MNIEEQEKHVDRKYRRGGVTVKTVGDLKKTLAELPDWIPIDRGLARKPRRAVVTRSIRQTGDRLEFLLDESDE
jgi:hypothetical protein